MPPVRKISKEDIIQAALEILKSEELDSLNARKLASDLNSSVQPIFYNFKNMEELKKRIVQEMYQIYMSMMNKGKSHEKPYKGMGLAYIEFARIYPNYFKILFMSKYDETPESFVFNDSKGNDVIAMGQKLTGFSEEKMRKFHVKVWIFTHGLACMVATNTVKLSNSEIDELLESTVKAMIIGEKELCK